MSINWRASLVTGTRSRFQLQWAKKWIHTTLPISYRDDAPFESKITCVQVRHGKHTCISLYIHIHIWSIDMYIHIVMFSSCTCMKSDMYITYICILYIYIDSIWLYSYCSYDPQIHPENCCGFFLNSAWRAQHATRDVTGKSDHSAITIGKKGCSSCHLRSDPAKFKRCPVKIDLLEEVLGM